MLLQVPHHLIELVLCDFSAGVPSPEDRVGIISVPPIAPSVAVPTPAPAAPPAHSPEEEEEQEDEEPAEAEREEWEEACPAARAPDGEQDHRSGNRDAD